MLFRSLGKTFDAMADAAGLSDLGLLRGQLVARTAHPLESPEFGKLLQDEIAPALFAALRRSRKWRFERKGFALIGDGLADSYGAMQWHQARAVRHAIPANFHQWRKQVKYHGNQLTLLKPAAPHMIAASLKAAARLAEALGDHHDLDALRSALFDVRSHPDEQAALLAAIGSRKASLEAAAFRLGNEIGAERPRDLLRRIRGYWRDWRG